jgi:hypothetical protein
MPGEIQSPPASSFFAASASSGLSHFAKSFEEFLASKGSSGKGANGFPQMVNDIDHFLRQVCVPDSSNLCFQIDGAPFQASYEPSDKGVKLQFWAHLGYLPFSVESAQRRRMLIDILEGSRLLPTVKFGVDRENQIIVTQTTFVPTIQPPAFIFVPLLAFVQEAMPFIRLIGECL